MYNENNKVVFQKLVPCLLRLFLKTPMAICYVWYPSCHFIVFFVRTRLNTINPMSSAFLSLNCDKLFQLTSLVNKLSLNLLCYPFCHFMISYISLNAFPDNKRKVCLSCFLPETEVRKLFLFSIVARGEKLD